MSSLVLPPELRDLADGFTWERVTLGQSASRVFRLVGPGATPPLYLKVPRPVTGLDLRGERDRLEWLQGRIPVPRVVRYVEDDGYQYLLTTGVPGLPACDPSFGHKLPLLVSLLAEGLRLIHAVPIDTCPFDARLDVQVALAHQHMVDGLVDEDDFDEGRRGQTAAEVFEELVRARPATEDLVFTHGDYCLPNVIIMEDTISGFVDLGSAGVADRYRDLALASRSISRNFGPQWVGPFFEAYGIAHPDRARVEFYQLLDEFF